MVGPGWRAPWALVLVTLVVMLAAACGPAPAAQPQNTPLPAPGSTVTYPLTVVDGQGRTITLPAQPQRIASLSPGHSEVFFAIGAGPQVIAVDKFSTYPPEAAQRTQLDSFQPNLEAIAALQPDLVLLTYDPGGLVEGLERLKTNVYYAQTPISFEGVLEQIHLLGRVVGHQEEADRLADDMRKRAETLRSKVAQAASRPRVFHEVDPTLYTASAKSFVGDLYTMLGARNIAADAAGEYPQMTQEAIIQRDPEVIILADEGAGESAETVKARPGWAAISAVKNGRVHLVDPDLVSRPGPRVVDGMEVLAKLLYPDLYRGQEPAY